MLDLPRAEARHYDSAHGANAAVAAELFRKLKAPLGCARRARSCKRATLTDRSAHGECVLVGAALIVSCVSLCAPSAKFDSPALLHHAAVLEGTALCGDNQPSQSAVKR